MLADDDVVGKLPLKTKDDPMATTPPSAGHLHQPDYLKGLAKQLREEADRAEARAKALESNAIQASCSPGCWNVMSTCIQVQPL